MNSFTPLHQSSECIHEDRSKKELHSYGKPKHHKTIKERNLGILQTLSKNEDKTRVLTYLGYFNDCVDDKS